MGLQLVDQEQGVGSVGALGGNGGCHGAILPRQAERVKAALARGLIALLLGDMAQACAPAATGPPGSERGAIARRTLAHGEYMEEVASSASDGPTVLVTTYDRDSIWTVERGVLLVAADVSTRDRTVRLRGRRYRYPEVAPAELLRLPERPEGTIPIHRLASVPDRKSLEDLIAAFRGRP